MKKTIRYSAAALSALMTLSLFGACGSKDETGAVSYVGIDVNPSVSLLLDKNDKVLSVVAENEDAQVLLYGESSLVGMDAEDAAKKIAELSVELGYLNEDNKGVNITVEGKAGGDLTNDIQAAFQASAQGLGLNFSSEGTFSANRKTQAVNAEYGLNLSVGKFRLIVDARAADGTLTWEAAADMDVSELLDIVAEAAETVEPYATAAYNTAKETAACIYESAKGQLVDSLWMLPYNTTYVAQVLTGQKVHYGAIYNLYTGASRVLHAGLNAAEAAEEAAEKMTVSDGTLDAIAAALNLTEEEKAQFIAQVTEDGKTVAALDAWLDVWFKNMTEEARRQIADKIAEVTEAVQAEADKIDASVAQEYKDAFKKLCSDLTGLIPDSIRNTAKTYLDEFSALVTDISEAADGKEPKAAAYAVKEAFDKRAESVMTAMRDDLTEEDIKTVEAAIQKVNDALAQAEEIYRNALEEAETQAKEYLAALKAARQNENA